VWYALPAGFVLGLTEDVVTARCLGSRAVALGLAALVAAGIRSVLNPDSLYSKALAAFCGTTVADYVTWGLLAAKDIRITSAYFLRSIWIPSALWSLALIGPLEFSLRRIALAAQSVWPSPGRKGRETAL
jgi:rod shape-determining protein MreD